MPAHAILTIHNSHKGPARRYERFGLSFLHSRMKSSRGAHTK